MLRWRTVLSRSNPLLWPKPNGIWGYGLAVLSVAAALAVSRLPAIHLQDAPVSLFLCAVILSAWFGGVWPGLLATAFSALAFNYYFLPPVFSLGPKPDEIPRLVIFTVSALFVGALSAAQRNATESLRGARDALRETVQKLQRSYTELQSESLERRHAEESLRQSEGYLADAQRLSHTGSWASRPDKGEIRYLSAECYRVLGFDPRGGQPQYETFLQRVHPDDRAKVREAVETAAREKAEYELDYRIVHPGGDIRDIHVVGHPVLGKSGDLVEFVGTVMDVTERRRADQALRRSEAYLAEAQRLTHVGSWARNVITGELIHSSEEHSRLFGFDPEREVPSFEEFVQRIHREDRGWVLQTFESASREGKDFDAYFRVVLPDGATKYVYGTGHPAVFNPSGEVVEYVGIVMDVTERRRADEERERLRQAQAELAHINRAATMGELTASLAHEVNQPIAAAVTNANTCLRWLAREQPDLEEARAAALRIVKDGTRAAEIIKRIRLLFKKETAERELVDINEVIREMIVLLRGEAMRYSVLMSAQLEQDAPVVMADRVQLQQVLMNLMVNGIDAMKDVGWARELVIKSQRDKNRQILVSVNDTGLGLPPQRSEQVFEAFFTTKPHGTGMGLSISRSIVESHGGRLWATSNPPRGASFFFALPENTEAKE